MGYVIFKRGKQQQQQRQQISRAKMNLQWWTRKKSSLLILSLVVYFLPLTSAGSNHRKLQIQSNAKESETAVEVCVSAIADSDTLPRDAQLTKTEYVNLLNSLSQEDYQNLDFEQLPQDLKANYENFEQVDGSLSIFGAQLGESFFASEEQKVFLRNFCLGTSELLDNAGTEVKSPAPSATPTISEAMVTPGPSPSVISCFVAFSAVDENEDDQMNTTEYITFVSELSNNGFINEISIEEYTFDTLPNSLRNNFLELAGPNNSINIAGSKAGSNLSVEQREFLRRVCVNTNAAISLADTILSPSPSPTSDSAQPSVPSILEEVIEIRSRFIISNDAGLPAADLMRGEGDVRTKLSFAYNEMTRQAVEQMESLSGSNSRRKLRGAERKLLVTHVVDSGRADNFTDTSCPISVINEGLCQVVNASFKVSVTNDEDVNTVQQNLIGIVNKDIDSGKLESLLIEQNSNLNVYAFSGQNPLPAPTSPPIDIPRLTELNIPVSLVISNTIGFDAADLVQGSLERSNLQKALELMGSSVILERGGLESYVDGSGVIADIFDIDCPDIVSGLCQSVFAFYKIEVDISNIESVPYLSDIRQDTLEAIKEGFFDEALSKINADSDFRVVKGLVPLRPDNEPPGPQFDITAEFVISNAIGVKAEDLVEASLLRSNMEKAFGVMCSSVVSQSDGSEQFVPRSGVLKDIFDTECPQTVSGVCQSVFAQCTIEGSYSESASVLAEFRQDLLEAIGKGLFDEALNDIDEDLSFKVIRGLIPTRPGATPSQSPVMTDDPNAIQNDSNSEGDQNTIAVMVIVPIVVVVVVVGIFVYIIYFRNNSPKARKYQGNENEDYYTPTEIQKEQQKESFFSPRYNHSKPDDLNPILSEDNSAMQQSDLYNSSEGFAMFEPPNDPLEATVEANLSNVVTRDGTLSTADATHHDNVRQYKCVESEGSSFRPPRAYDKISISDSSDYDSSSSNSDSSSTMESEGSDEELNRQFYGETSNQNQQQEKNILPTAASAFAPIKTTKDDQFLKSEESTSDSNSESDSSSYDSSSESESSSAQSYGQKNNNEKSHQSDQVPDTSFFTSDSNLRAPSFDNEWPTSTFEDDKFNDEVNANGMGSMNSGFPVANVGTKMNEISMAANQSTSTSESDSESSSSSDSDQNSNSSSDSSTDSSSTSSSDSDSQMDYVALQSPVNTSRDFAARFENNTESTAATPPPLTDSVLESDAGSTSETDSNSSSNSNLDSLSENHCEAEKVEVANRNLSERKNEQTITDDKISDLAGAAVATLSIQKSMEEDDSGVASDSLVKGSMESNNETIQTASDADGSVDDGINHTTAATAGAISTLSMWSADESKDDNVINGESESPKNKVTKVDYANSDAIPRQIERDSEAPEKKSSETTSTAFFKGSEKDYAEGQVPSDSGPVLKVNANEEALLSLQDKKEGERKNNEASSPVVAETGFALDAITCELAAGSGLDDVDTDQVRESSGQASCEKGGESLLEDESGQVLHKTEEQEILVIPPFAAGKSHAVVDQTSDCNDINDDMNNVKDETQNFVESTTENDMTRRNSENNDRSAENINDEIAKSVESEGIDEPSITKTDEVHNMFMTRALERACSKHEGIDREQNCSNEPDVKNHDRIARKVEEEGSHGILTTFGESEGTGGSEVTQTRVISELSTSEVSSRGDLQSSYVASTSGFVEPPKEDEGLGRTIENEDNNLLRSALDDDSDSGSEDTEYTDSDDNSYDEETYIHSLGTYEDTMGDMGPEEALAFAMAAAKRIDEQAEADTSTITGGTIPDTDEFEKQIADFQAHDIRGVLKKSDDEKQKEEDFLVGREIEKASMDTSSDEMNSKDIHQLTPDLESTDESNKNSSLPESSSTDNSDSGSGSDSNCSDSSDESSLEETEDDSSEEEPSVLAARSYYTNGSEGKGLLNDPTEFRRQLQIRQDVEELVRELVPEEVENLDAMFVQFAGREEELLNTLNTMRERRAKVRARAAEHKSKTRKPRRIRTSQSHGIFVAKGEGSLSGGGVNAWSASSSSGSSSQFAQSSGTSSSGGESSRHKRALKSG